MSGVSTRRCPGCHEVVVVSDRGKVRRVGNARYVETLPNGDTVFACPCGEQVVWERQPAPDMIR